MGLLRAIRSNLLILVIVAVVAVWGFSVYANQSAMLAKLGDDRLERERALEEAKSNYERTADLEKAMNTAQAKEKQIRERLNMVKKDEIQFIFTN